MGKGSKPRPFEVDQKTFDNNWEQIFGKKTKDQEKKDESIDSGRRDNNQQQGESL
jgi:hypothetical protein